MTFTAIDELPLPPAPMVEDAKKDDLAEAHSLLPQLWTIREFRKIALPIVLGVKSGTGPIMRDAIAEVEKYKQEKWHPRFPNYKKFPFREAIGKLTDLRDAKRKAAKAFQEKQLEKFVAFKNGRVPKNRLNAARNMSGYWNPTWREDVPYVFYTFGDSKKPSSWLDAHNIPRDRAGLKFGGVDKSYVWGDMFVKKRFHTRWEMMDYWKKNYKYADVGHKLPTSKFVEMLFELRCVIY